MIQPTKWLCAPRRLRSAWASAQSDQSLRCPAWRKLGSLGTHWAQSEDWLDWEDTQADLSLRWAQSHFVGFVMNRLIYRADPKPCLFWIVIPYSYMQYRPRSIIIEWRNDFYHEKKKRKKKKRFFLSKTWPKTFIRHSISIGRERTTGDRKFKFIPGIHWICNFPRN